MKIVHVMAGVPSVFQAMVASVLPTLIGGEPLTSVSVRIERGEGDIAAPLAALAADFPDLSVGSYPFQRDGRYGSNIVVRGSSASAVEAAITALCAVFPEAVR
jgi:molybdopterin-biosynthesis enzyme MoeA-like protein